MATIREQSRGEREVVVGGRDEPATASLEHRRPVEPPVGGVIDHRLTGSGIVALVRRREPTDALAAHARDELGITEFQAARPVQAALASAATFLCGAIIPVLLAAAVPRSYTTVVVVIATLAVLATLGALAARVGGASTRIGAIRVTFWGALAMAVTAGVGALFHVAV